MSIKRTDTGPILSKMVETDDVVYLAGLTADDEKKDVAGQTKEILAKIDSYLAKAGTDKTKLLSANIWLSKLSLKPQMNEVWTKWIDPKNPPARACVGAELGGNVLVEIMVTAKKR